MIITFIAVIIIIMTIMIIKTTMVRVRVEYGQDGSLESRLYLTGAGKADTGRWMMMIIIVMTLL